MIVKNELIVDNLDKGSSCAFDKVEIQSQSDNNKLQITTISLLLARKPKVTMCNCDHLTAKLISHTGMRHICYIPFH